MSNDPTSQANFLQITSQHIDFSWSIDFEQKAIIGSAVHTLLVKEDGVTEVM
jgi:leukotriene-A4 hydrolase